MLEADNPRKLMQALSRLDITVPPRSKGRTKEHTERYAVAYLLSTLGHRAGLVYPLRLVRRDRPDFLLCMAGHRIGIEHTEAVPQNEAHKLFLREKGNGPRIHFVPRAKHGEARKSRKQLICEIEQNDPGRGWEGDTAEQEWTEAMSYFVQRKAAKLEEPGFDRFEKDWLLIYDNWPFPHVRSEVAGEVLYDLLGRTAGIEKFDRVFILRGHHLCDISRAGTSLAPLNRLWS